MVKRIEPMRQCPRHLKQSERNSLVKVESKPFLPMRQVSIDMSKPRRNQNRSPGEVNVAKKKGLLSDQQLLDSNEHSFEDSLEFTSRNSNTNDSVIKTRRGPLGRPSGFQEVKNKFDQKAVMEYFDKLAGTTKDVRLYDIRETQVKAPSSRFLSPLAQGGLTFDKRRFSKHSSNLAETQLERDIKKLMRDPSIKSRQELLLNSMNQNLKEIDHRVQVQEQRNIKIQETLETPVNQIIWDANKIKQKNEVLA